MKDFRTLHESAAVIPAHQKPSKQGDVGGDGHLYDSCLPAALPASCRNLTRDRFVTSRLSLSRCHDMYDTDALRDLKSL